VGENITLRGIKSMLKNTVPGIRFVGDIKARNKDTGVQIAVINDTVQRINRWTIFNVQNFV
jgi:hypothetical protein